MATQALAVRGSVIGITKGLSRYLSQRKRMLELGDFVDDLAHKIADGAQASREPFSRACVQPDGRK